MRRISTKVSESAQSVERVDGHSVKSLTVLVRYTIVVRNLTKREEGNSKRDKTKSEGEVELKKIID